MGIRKDLFAPKLPFRRHHTYRHLVILRPQHDGLLRGQSLHHHTAIGVDIWHMACNMATEILNRERWQITRQAFQRLDRIFNHLMPKRGHIFEAPRLRPQQTFIMGDHRSDVTILMNIHVAALTLLNQVGLPRRNIAQRVSQPLWIANTPRRSSDLLGKAGNTILNLISRQPKIDRTTMSGESHISQMAVHHPRTKNHRVINGHTLRLMYRHGIAAGHAI